MNAVCPVIGQHLLISRSDRVLLSVDRITFGRPLAQRVATDKQNSGSCVVILGPNGAGKSLLVKTLCALQVPDKGQVLWADSAPDKQRRHQVGLMLQKPVLLRRSAESNLVYALRLKGHDKQQSLRLSRDALQQAGLAHVARVSATRLSGGEQQRLALLRALLLEPDILFLDEATANVDPGSTLAIEQQLAQAKARGITIVMVSHDIAQARRLADEVILMHQGQIVERAECAMFFESPTKHLTKRWIEGELLV